MRTYILTSPHAKGPEVVHLQELLKQHGFYHNAVDGEYGPYTAQSVYRAKHWFGYPKPDQIAGDILVKYLTGRLKPSRVMIKTAHKRAAARPLPGAVTLGQKMLDFEISQLGIKEEPAGSNHTKYGVWYGVDHQPWCAIFQSFAASHVGLKFHYAYVPSVVADARAGRNRLTLVHASQVRPGDLVTYDWPGESKGVADHIGCFRRWNDSSHNSFTAVEGNTSEGNNSNGGEVQNRSDRIITEVLAFVRIGGAQ